MSRSEAARHASLVRWKKESPLSASVAERLAQIRAARAEKLRKKAAGGKGKAKGKAGGKGKAAAKPKDARTKQEKANQNRAAVAKQSIGNDLEGTIVRLGAGMHSDLEKDAHDKLISKGLAQRGADGTVTLTAAGKKWRSAADKGDAEGAAAALSEGQAKAGDKAAREKVKGEKQAAREQEKQGKVAERAKAKAARDQARAKRAEERAKAKKQAGKAKARSQEQRNAERAARNAARNQRAQDREQARKQKQADREKAKADKEQARSARATAAETLQRQKDMLGVVKTEEYTMSDYTPILDDIAAITGELAEVAEDDLAEIKAGRRNAAGDQAQIDKGYEMAMQLCDLFESLGADTGEEEGEEDDADMEDMEMEGKADTFGGKKRDDLKDSDFAGPNRTYPIMTAQDVKDAASLIGKADDPEAVKAKIIAIARRKGFADALPEAWKEGGATKGIELYHTEAGEECATLAGYSVKAVGDGWTGGYLVKFGGDGDLSHWRDVFDRHTDYGRATKSDVWVHHRMLPGVGKRRLNNQAEIGIDDEGVFIKHLLDLRSSYERKLYGLVQDDKLGWSSGTAPHLVERKALGDGRHAIEQWPLGLDASYTPMPAGGFGVEARAGSMKSLLADAGIDLLNAIYDNQEAQDEGGERPDGAKAADERTRRLLLELELLSLEATT